MDYAHIGGFFKKIHSLLSKEEDTIKAIQICILNHTKVSLDKKNIKVKGPVAYIRASPLMQNEILISKQKILADLARVIPDRNITDIR